MRGWDIFLPGRHWIYEPQVVFSTPWGAVSTRGTTVFVSGLLELWMDRRISDLGMGRYPPRVALSLRNPRAWFPHRTGLSLIHI